MLALNETQAGVLQMVFQDRRRQRPSGAGPGTCAPILQYVGDNASPIHHPVRQRLGRQHWRHSARAALQIEAQGGDKFWRADAQHRRLHATEGGKGVSEHPRASTAELMNSPASLPAVDAIRAVPGFSPEVGDQPRTGVLLQAGRTCSSRTAPAALIGIGWSVRLVRSGRGRLFRDAEPARRPGPCWSQLGNRVQHAAAAFTPRDQKAVKTTPPRDHALRGPGHRPNRRGPLVISTPAAPR